jgi:predicted GNAT family acetyltransferase
MIPGSGVGEMVGDGGSVSMGARVAVGTAVASGVIAGSAHAASTRVMINKGRNRDKIVSISRSISIDEGTDPMRIQRFERVEDFMARALPYLSIHEAEHNMILGICGTIMQGAAHYDDPMYFATIEEDGEVIGATIRTPPRQLHLSQMPAQALPLIAEDVMSIYGATIPGVVAQVTLGDAFAGEWSRITGLRSHQNLSMRIFKLTRVRPINDSPGAFRRALPTDRALLGSWMHAFFIEALGHDDPAQAEEWLEGSLKGGARGLFVWEDDGEVVSMAGYTGPTPNGIRLTGVYTPPELRGRGYASTCVAALSQYLLEGGRKFVFLFTDIANPTSNHIYQEIGYEPVADVSEIVFE